MTLSIPPHIQTLKPYTPGKPLAALLREYGIRDAIKLASNENPLGPSPLALAAIQKALAGLHHYPDGAAYDLTHGLADFLGVAPPMLVPGNGSDDIIALLTRALLQPGDEVLIPCPTFLMYDILVRSTGATVIEVPLCDLRIDVEALLARVTDRCRMVFICNPNNPTGRVLTRLEFEHLLARLPADILVVVDEAYFEFVTDPATFNGLDYVSTGRVAVLRTFSKAYGLAGLRVGYGVMAPFLAEVLHRVRQPFNVSLPAQAGALAALADHDFLAQTRELVHSQLQRLYRGLQHLQIPYFETQANFFLIDVAQPSEAVFERLLYEGVIVRAMTGYGYPYYIRVSVGLPEQNQRFLKALPKVLARRQLCGTSFFQKAGDPLLIVIDGPAGAGKSTVSRRLAACLGYRYLDTGALYRAVAVEVLDQQIDATNDLAVARLLETIQLEVTAEGAELRLRVNGRDVSSRLRISTVSMTASQVSALPSVRAFLLDYQRSLAATKGVVAEGRDLGTVVFPTADLKFFLDADPAIRASRRFQEMAAEDRSSLEHVASELQTRDQQDRQRDLAPLQTAPDAIVIDSSNMPVAEIIQSLLAMVYKAWEPKYQTL